MSPNSKFFEIDTSISLQDILENIEGLFCEIENAENICIQAVSPLASANKGDLTFFDNIKYKDSLQDTKASFCVISSEFKDLLPPETFPIVSKSPYRDYALISQYIYTSLADDVVNGISEHAVIESSAQIGNNVSIEPGAIIQDGVVVGDHCYIEAGAVLRKNVKIGTHCRIGTNAVLSHCEIGDHCHIYTGAKIGQDGFGFAMDISGFVKVPQLGMVEIGQGVHVGANTTIDRGSLGNTIIGDGTWIDNLVQIAHNVKIGRMCVIVSQVGISGSTVLEDFVVLGGQVGIAGHLNIGQGARLAAKSGVMRDVPAGEEYMGAPALPKREFMRQFTALKRLTKQAKK